MNEELKWKQRYEKKRLELSQLLEKLTIAAKKWRGNVSGEELIEVLQPYWRRQEAAQKLQERVKTIEHWRAGGDDNTADLIQFDSSGRCTICQKLMSDDRHVCWKTPEFPFDVLEEWPL